NARVRPCPYREDRGVPRGTPPRRRRPVARTRSRENLACKLLGSPYRNGSPELSSCHTSTASFRAQAATATLRFFRLAILREGLSQRSAILPQMLRGLHQQPARMRITLFGDRPVIAVWPRLSRRGIQY